MTNTPVKSPFHILAKPVGPACNMSCDYCFYLEKESLFPSEATFKMEPDVLESFIIQYIESQPTNAAQFTWQGGEPTLLGIPYFEEIVKLQQKHSGDKQITNAIQTNGILLDEDWGQFLFENNFLVGISIDGPKALHDQYRIGHDDNGTFEKVMIGLEILKKYKIEFNTLTVVNRGNQSEAIVIYNFLKSIGSGYWQFIPAVERARPNGSLAAPHEADNLDMAEWSVEPEAYGQFLSEIFQRWVREDVGSIFVQQFEAALANEMGRPAGVCVWNANCGQALAVEHNGDLYSCDHYVFPEYRLGNILEFPILSLVHSTAQQEFGKDKFNGLPQICRDCEVLYLCHGECPKHRFVEGPNGEQGHNYLCSGYKQFFSSIRPELGVFKEILELGQPATNIVAWMQEKDQGFPNIEVELSETCPCGSSLAFKDCCFIKRNNI
ncbi:MAG: anaerobic sulfatase maturase [Candidatus Marinimicrobia bacterium]|nr:anaerobic sulfatase maturase [Candidatus Neomarinimicrobiota bacterium]MBT4715848.1 anaerobic sulfatase maturase [Candidatus Neomarinimicrobiota bacterium]MBT6009911.1 anaerobic sulfatase maturase [Candidatus Neomarinimicrobiota bacterium]